MIYVDDVGIPATVWNKRTGRYVDSRWYHLISDQLNTAELHAFAARLGLHRSYFQEGKDILGCGPYSRRCSCSAMGCTHAGHSRTLRSTERASR